MKGCSLNQPLFLPNQPLFLLLLFFFFLSFLFLSFLHVCHPVALVSLQTIKQPWNQAVREALFSEELS